LIQDTTADSEALFRALVALGTALSVDNDEVKAAASQIFGVKEALQDVKKRQSENRIKQVISEIEGFLS
jgi:predicted metal-dependent peptidase